MKNKMRKELGVLGLVSIALLMAFMLPIAKANAQAESGEHGYLGVALQNLDEETRQALKFKDSGGAFVDDVVDDSPAAKAGIKGGDVIVRFNDKTFKDEAELRDLILAAKPGDKVAVAVFRDGDKKSFDVVMGKAMDFPPEFTMKKMMKPGRARMMMKGMGCCGGACKVRLGVEVQRLSDQLAEYFKVKDGEGMLVAGVMKDSPAEKAGIKAGDVIVKVGDKEVEKRADLRKAICGKKAGDEVAVEIVRDGVSKTIRVTLAEAPQGCHEGMPMMGRGYGRFNPEDLDIDLEEMGPEMQEYMKELRIEMDRPREDLQEQLDELKAELEKLKAEMEHK